MINYKMYACEKVNWEFNVLGGKGRNKGAKITV
jgi:hypothetical protein